MCQPQQDSGFSLGGLFRRAVALGEHAVQTPDRVETRVNEATSAIQHGVEQLVFWAQVLVAVVVVVALVRLAIAFYMWNLRRREVIAEEKQAAAEARQATALEGILAKLEKLSAGK